VVAKATHDTKEPKNQGRSGFFTKKELLINLTALFL